MGTAVSKPHQPLGELDRKGSLPRVLMLGLDGVGKTSILYRQKFGERHPPIRLTNGFNLETIKINGRRFSIWDIGGRKSIRRWWKEYYDGAVVVMFVVDSNDRHRLEEARDALHQVMDHDALKNARLLVLANKQDLQNAMDIHEFRKGLDLHDLDSHLWHILPTSAISGEGVKEAFKWVEDVGIRR